MIKKETQLLVSDNSGARLAKCIGFLGKKKVGYIGNLILISLTKLVHSKKVKKRTIYLGLIISVVYWISRSDGSLIRFFLNRLLIFNKNLKFLGTRVYGGILKEIKIKAIKDKNYRKTFQKIISYSSIIV